MGHHSHLRLGHGRVFWNRDTYDPGLAALFTEEDRRYDDGRYGYYTTVGAMRQRLLLQGITATRAHADLDAGIEQWQQNKSPDEDVPSSTEELLHAYRTLITASEWDDIDQEEPWHILFYVDCRSILRLLVDMVPDDADVVLDLSELTGCCVELDPDKPIAQIERADQLARVAVDAPLIVLTEGRSDSRLLSLAMKITHPHLVGFINFIDFEGTHGAEGGVGALARMVYSFVAAGVANRFVAHRRQRHYGP